MEEDLKIVLSSELETDEEASAKRISAQLPNIAKLINSKSTIKVGVELAKSATQDIQSQTQKISAQISKAANVDVGLNLHVTKDAKKMLKDALGNVGDGGVDASITAALTKNLDNMEVKVKNIHAEWVKVGKTKERLLQLSVSGTTKDQQDIEILQQYDESGRKVLETTKSLSLNLEKIEQQEKRSADMAKKDNESRVLYLNKLRSGLEDIYMKYADLNSAKPIHDSDHFADLDQRYQSIAVQLSELEKAEGKLSAQQKVDIENQIDGLSRLVKSYQNVEYVATKLRTKTVGDVKSEQVQNLDEYESKLKSSGQLTQTFQSRINELRQSLSKAFDSGSLTNYLNQFDHLKSEVGAFDSQLSSVNKLFKDLASAKSDVYATKGKMIGLDEDSAQYKELEQLLAMQVQHQKDISSEIGKQIAKNPELIKYASEYKNYQYASAEAAANLAIQEGRVEDAVRNIDASMQPIPATVQNIENRFRTLSNAPEELAQKVSSLSELMNAVFNAKNKSDEIAAWKKLKEAMNGCNKEITQLLIAQNTDVRNFKFTENLEKAKADLATIGRQWSALFSDGGLKASYQNLEAGLKAIVENDYIALSKWTAEFNRFKSEVKAAGKNVQSFKDILKNNIGKVAQWGLATISIYDVINRLKSAVTTVVELDTAMIDLRKTTDETDAAYKRFYLSANDTAKRLGVTTAEVIAQTAEWSRLGYSMAEAAKMAENSAIFAAISPELNTEEATDGLISIMKAFGYEANEVLDGVISKINKLGNELAISNKDIVEVMTRASSAMQAANNSFEQTSALAVAAVEITRNSEQAGKPLPDAVVIQYKKVAISVKGRRRFRPSKDFAIYFTVPVGSWHCRSEKVL